MTSMPGPLDQSRRQIVRAFAIGVVGSAVLFGVVLLALLFIDPNPGFMIILALVVFDIAIGSAALAFQKSRPLWQSILPLAGILSLGVVTAGTLFPEAKTGILPIFIVVVLLISIIGDLRITFAAVVLCGLLTVAML